MSLLILVALLYFSGSLDRALVDWGLNWNKCYQNAFGATFCGEEAERYRENIRPFR